MFPKKQRDPIRALSWSTREWRVLTLSIVTALGTALLGVAINFNHKIFDFFRPHAGLPVVQFLINFLVVWLVVLLVASYWRWRNAAMKNQELEDIVDSISPDVLLVVDQSRNILMTSVSVSRMFGHDPGEVVGRKTDLLYGDRRRMLDVKHEVHDALEKEGFHIGWATGKRKDGNIFPLEIITGILKHHGGSVLLLRDVTERKNAEELLIERETQLRHSQKMEALGLLAGGVAHDFNNLLTSILGFGSLALESLPEGHPARVDVKEVVASAERAAKLTAQLLAVGRKQSMQITRLELNGVVDGMVLLLKRTLGEDVTLDIQLDSRVGFIEADLGGIEQVILNLAVNARDAMPHGGTLHIETRPVILDAEYCRLHVAVEPGAYGQLVVRDSGCGMRPEVREHVFEPFFTTKEKGRGTGLGLSMVYGIVRQCGGYIELDSQPGAGSEFRISFRTSKEAPSPVVEGAPAPSCAGNEALLVVEDDAAVREFDVRVLAEMGYRVLDATSPDEAIRMGREYQGSIDLVLADVVLPEMSGVALVDQLRKTRPGIKALFVTGFDERSAVERGVNLKADAVLMKPYKQEALAFKIRQVLDAEK